MTEYLYEEKAILYILQTQIKRNELHLFMVSDSKEQENVTLTLKIDIYNNNGLFYIPKLLHDEIVVNLKDNNINEIMDFSASILRYSILNVQYIEITEIAITSNYTNKIIYINYPYNTDILNTQKVDELIDNGEVNFYNKYYLVKNMYYSFLNIMDILYFHNYLYL